MLTINKASLDDLEFIFCCLKELRGSVNYTLNDFKKYVTSNNILSSPNFEIFIFKDGKNNIAIITSNKFSIPRYLGFGIEIEEIVVAKNFRGLGYGKKVIKIFIKYFQSKKHIRKIVVRTDDFSIAGPLYENFFNKSNIKTFSSNINPI